MINIRKITFLTIALTSVMGGFRSTCGASFLQSLCKVPIETIKTAEHIKDLTEGVKKSLKNVEDVSSKLNSKVEKAVTQWEKTANKLDQTLNKMTPKAEKLMDTITLFFSLSCILVAVWILKLCVAPVVLYVARKLAKSIKKSKKYSCQIYEEREPPKKSVSYPKMAKKATLHGEVTPYPSLTGYTESC